MSADAELLELAVQEGLAPDLLSRLVRHDGARRQMALSRRDLSLELAEEIIALGSARTLAANSSLPPGARALLVDHPQTEVRAALAANADDDPPGILVRLSQDPEPFVRSFLAMNDRLDPAVRARLATDPDREVRSSLARHWLDAPDEVRRALLTDPDSDVRRGAVHAYEPPPDLLPELLRDPVTRAGVVRHAEPTGDLATDPDADVRRALARHPALSAHLRDLLAADPDVLVRDAVAARPDTPSALREELEPTLHSDDPVEQWLIGFSRHQCPPSEERPAPGGRTRAEAEALLTGAGL
ncbi:hypothetical protein [Streptacidiphilus jiangxiensis]|uniref:Leucine rich repeat variant n=1 Tax=Streptacidiphilus jiangxiensis TaxID=235985 RepID=A0A1H7NE39_STRJI|nr:hypothetical protein [Streptacidiphilus jiangxiensis]SEL21255.1 hypothetical protein SAMN05414137_106318 [Streptacidiphilus jiangxiensis]